MPATLNLATVSTVRFPSSCDNRAANGSFRRRYSIHAIASPAAPATATATASLYEVLRVEQNASPTEIKSAFRSLAKLYHPDVAAVRRLPESVSGEGDFIEIRNAYETLSDPSARAMYDLSLTSRRRRFPAPLSVDRNSGYYPTRRWETDQCW